MDFPIELPPEFLEKAKTLQILPEEIDGQFVRGGGAGGQKINKTSSCVWLKHVKSGVEVKCQKYRERPKNRLSAYKLLIAKIEREYLGKKSAQETAIFKLRKQKKRRTRRAKEKILQDKSMRSQIKELRKSPKI